MSSKLIDVDVNLLDSTTRSFHLPLRAIGHELYTMVVEHLQLVEYDYFDLEYINKDGLHCWLDHSKAVNKQMNLSKRFLYSFVVKFYTPHPNLLEDELTRYLFALQIKNDLRSGRLQCSESTAALLAAFVVQAKVGDFLEDIYQDHSYLIGLHLLNQPSEDMLKKIAECHRNLIGQTPAEADYNLLDTARKVELYGVRFNPAKDNIGLNVNLTVIHSGICVYQGGVRTNMFSWARIRKLSFKRKNFYIKVHPEGYDAIGFSFSTRNECKSFWKQCIEHHSFFRCQAVRNVGRKSRVVSKGSSFRYMGRTQKQLTDFIRENYIKMPNFERSSSTGRVLNTETSALILSSLKSQEKEIRNNLDAQGNAVIHSDGDAILYRNRPQTDPSQRIHLSNNLVSAESARSVAVAIPLSGQLNYIGSGGPYQIIPENLQTIKQRRSGSAVGQVFVAGINPHTAHFLSTMGTASSGTYTMNSSVSAGTPTGSGSPTGSPHMEDKPTNVITSSEQPAHLVWPNKLNVRPLSVSNLALQRPASAPQSGWRASLPRHVMPNTSNILIGQPNVTPSGPMNVTLIGTDSYPSMHASLLLTSKPQYGQNHQTNQTQGNNLQSVTTTNMIMASNPILSSSINPVRAICMPIQHQQVQLAQITADGNKAVHSQIKLPPGCAILTGSGQTSNIGGRIIYVDRATGQSYIPVLTNTSGDLNQVIIDGNVPLTIRQSQLSHGATTSMMVNQQQQQQQQSVSTCTTNNLEIPSQPGQQHTAQINSVQSNNTSSVPPDVTRNARSLGRRLGPPPPAPERKDSVLQKTSEIKTQKCLTQSSSLSTPIQSEKTIKSLVRDQSDSQGEETSDSPHHSQNLHEKVHPLAVGMITGHNGLHSVSCLSLAARGRSTLSLANICVNDRDASDFDKASDDEQNELHSIHQYPCINSLHRSRILASVSARASDADVTDDDHHSVCSQRSSTARSVSAVCRHGHKHHHHHHHHHHHYNRQNRARCLSAIDPYLMSNHNVNDTDNQNTADKVTDVCKTEIPTNLRGTTTKSHSFRRLSKHHLDEAYHLVRELVMSERTYKRNLSIICVHFRDIGKDSLCSELNINPQLLQELTSRLVDLLSPIYTEHCLMLNNFENRLSNWSSQNGYSKQSNGLDSLTLNPQTVNTSSEFRIGDLFVSSLHILPMYHCYLTQAGNIMLDIEKLVRNRPEIEKLIRNFEAQKYCYLPFYVFLLKPMHRLLQYRVLLERLMRYYGEFHADLPDCRIAHAKLNDLIQSQWESYKRIENTYKLLEIQRDLIGFNPDLISSVELSQYSTLQNEKSNYDNHNTSNTTTNNSNKQTPIHASTCGSHSLGPVYHPNRQFIREGWLQKLSKKGYQARMFFLLSDQLVYASRTTAPFLQFKVHGQFSLQDLMVEEVEPAHSFTIYSGNRCFLVAASSDWQRDRWLEDISRAILAAKTRPSTFSNESAVNNIENKNESSMKILNCGTVESDSAQMLQRAVTSVHVCWHRCFTLSMQDILRANEFQTSGYLLRKFKNSNGWQRLWVVFTQLCLFFYKSYRDECPLASLPLLGYTISRPGVDDQIRRDNVLKMQFKNHVYFFRGETRHSFERWVEYLSCAAGASRPSNTSAT